jgi:hypothetical protein
MLCQSISISASSLQHFSLVQASNRDMLLVWQSRAEGVAVKEGVVNGAAVTAGMVTRHHLLVKPEEAGSHQSSSSGRNGLGCQASSVDSLVGVH